MSLSLHYFNVHRDSYAFILCLHFNGNQNEGIITNISKF